MALQVGELFAALTIDKTAFSSGLKESQGEASGWGSKVGGAIKDVAKVAAVAFAAISTALIATTTHAVDFAETYYVASKRVADITGMDIEAASQLVAIFQRYGLDGDVAIKTIGMLEKNVGNLTKTTKAETAFEKQYGVSLRDTSGAVKNASDLIGVGADIFTNKSIPAVQKAAAESKLFGKSWQSIVPILSLGAQGISDAEDEAAKLGMTLTASNASDLKNYKASTIAMDEAMGGLTLQLGLVAVPLFTLISTTLTQKVAPAIHTIVTVIGNWVKNSGALAAITKVVTAAMDTISSVITDLVGKFMDFMSQGDNMKNLLEALGLIVLVAVVPPFVAWAAATILATLPIVLLVAAVFLVVKALNDLGILQPLVTKATQFFGKALEYIQKTVLPALIAAFNWFIANVLPALGKALDWVVKNVIPPLRDSLDWFTTNVLPLLANAFQFIVDTVLPALAQAFDWFVKNVIPPVAAIIGDLADIFRNAFSIIQQVVQLAIAIITNLWHEFGDDILNGVKTAFTFVQETIQNALTIVQGVFDTFSALFKGDWSGVWDGIKKIFSGIWDEIGSIVKGAFGLLKTELDAFGKIFGNAWDAIFSGIKGGISIVWDAIVALIKAPINLIIGMVDTLIDALDSIQIHTPHMSIPNPLGGNIDMPSFDWNGFDIRKIKMLEAGGGASGWTLMGERGPELAKMPGGSQVYNAAQTAALLGRGGGGGGVTIGAIYGVQPDEVERQTTRGIRRAHLALSLAGR